MGDRPLQLRHAVEAAAADCLLADQAKSALHQVQPRGTGGREVKMEARMTLQPAADLLVFVRRIVVHDKMNA